MYKNRFIRKAFSFCIDNFPAVLLTGPRQSGKTTFLKNELPNASYLTFDDPLNRNFARQDPKGFLASFSSFPAIIDEIQYVPEILSYLKMDIDNNRTPGKWILTGSQQFHLMKNVSESLAGRIAILELLPFSYKEAYENASLEILLWNSLFPEPALNHQKRNFWFPSYIQTYLERDIRQIENIRDFRSFELLINLCAAQTSQECHPTNLARDCGVSVQTINNWLKLLEASYFIFFLPPFYKNIGKRLVKANKLYLIDTGIAAYLTKQPSPEAMLMSNMRGALFENFIVSETIKCFMNHGMKPDIFYWRSHDGLEVDLLIRIKNTIYPVEIKLTATPSEKHFDCINRLKKLLENTENVANGTLICQTTQKVQMPYENIAIPWFQFYDWLEEKLAY